MNSKIASGILARAFAELRAAGLDRLEAAHATIRAGLEQLAPAVNGCAGCAVGEYAAVAEAVEGLIVDAKTIADDPEHEALH